MKYLWWDADSLVYESAFAVQKEKDIDGNPIAEPVQNALQVMKCTIKNVLKRLDYQRGDWVQLVLTAEGLEKNFRYDIDNEYKANRKDYKKPIHYKACREYLVKYWKAIIVEGEEAEDYVSCRHCQCLNWDTTSVSKHSIIIAVDKDLDNTYGWHYNWHHKNLYHVCNITALMNFYKQLLVGDRADNIQGIKGIGPVKAKKLFDPIYCKNVRTDNLDIYTSLEKDLYQKVRELYNDDERLHKNAKLLWIRRVKDQIWGPPT